MSRLQRIIDSRAYSNRTGSSHQYTLEELVEELALAWPMEMQMLDVRQLADAIYVKPKTTGIFMTEVVDN